MLVTNLLVLFIFFTISCFLAWIIAPKDAKEDIKDIIRDCEGLRLILSVFIFSTSIIVSLVILGCLLDDETLLREESKTVSEQSIDEK